MKRKFDLKFKDKIESGELSVFTRDGRSVRIVCWDSIGDYPIVALVKCVAENKTYFEAPIRYDREGAPNVSADDKHEELYLFIEDDSVEFTDLENAVLESMKAYATNGDYINEIEFVKLTALKIRDVVIDELSKVEKLKNVEAVKEIAKMSGKTWEESFAILTAADMAYKKGKADTEKTLPKWKKSAVYNGVSGTDVLTFNEFGTTYYLNIEDLQGLPRE